MGNLIASMGDAESVLLLYLADELSAQDRAVVEQALAQDAALHDTLTRLRAMLDECNSMLRGLDELDFSSGDGSGMRLDRQAAVDQQARDIVRQWIAGPRVDPQLPVRRSPRAPLWTYPFAAAAAIVLGFLIYWGRAPVGPAVAHQQPATSPTEVASGRGRVPVGPAVAHQQPATPPTEVASGNGDSEPTTNPADVADVAVVDVSAPLLFPQSNGGIDNEQFLAMSDAGQKLIADTSTDSGAAPATQDNH